MRLHAWRAQLQGRARRIGVFLEAAGRQFIGWDEILEGGLAPQRHRHVLAGAPSSPAASAWRCAEQGLGGQVLQRRCGMHAPAACGGH